MVDVRWNDLLDLELKSNPTREDYRYLIGLVRELQLQVQRLENDGWDEHCSRYDDADSAYDRGYDAGYDDGYRDAESE